MSSPISSFSDRISKVHKLLGTPEVAGLLNVSQSTVRFWVVQGTGIGPKSFKIGRRRVWELEDVEAFISEQRAKGEKEVAR